MTLKTKDQGLVNQGNELFAKKDMLNCFWQEVAENFYPQRADFTNQRQVGQDFANNLTTSYPVLAHRDLSNAISTFLRPRSQEWFKMSIGNEEQLDNEGRRWLELATKRQKRFIYDKDSGFVRATKEADADFAAFGQAVIYVEADWNNISLIHHCCHLRDVAWCEDETGRIATLHRKKKWTARQLHGLFKDKIHPKVREKLEKDPYCEILCHHVMMKTENYKNDEKKIRQPYVSIWIDIENNHVMEEVGSWTFKYVVPRWQTVSGSQYAYSPSVVAALPDARLIQAVSLVLLEAGEKAVNPPLVAVQDVFRSDSLSTASATVNWIDSAYDERTGSPVRELYNTDKSALSFGINLREETKAMIMEAFYLNKLNLPISGPSMTATEVTARIQEYIRNALPLFEPMETEYNAAICQMQFETLFRAGAFGTIEEVPESLLGQDVKFVFENPLLQAEGKEKAQRFMEAKAMLAESMALDPTLGNMVDAKVALRDALNGAGVPAKWLRDEKEVQQMDDMAAQKQQAQEMLAALGQGAQVAEQVGKAGMAVQQAGIM